MPATELYLARHGQTEYNRRGLIQGREIDSSLNYIGDKQAEMFAERLFDVSFSAVYTSTLRRAEQTAAIVSPLQHDVPADRDADLEVAHDNTGLYHVIEMRSAEKFVDQTASRTSAGTRLLPDERNQQLRVIICVVELQE